MSKKISLKVLFSAMLPYGYLSPNALLLTLGMDANSCYEYAPNISMKEREIQCMYFRQYLQTFERGFEETGLFTKHTRKHGSKPFQKVFSTKLTPLSMEYLLDINGSFQDIFLVQTRGPYTPRVYSIETEAADTTSQETGLFPFLTSYLNKQNKPLNINDIGHYMSGSNGLQYHRSWKLGNIHTMFLINGFMTYLDRRPIVNGWSFCGTKQDIMESAQEMPSETNIFTITNLALKQWYEQYPDRNSCLESATTNMPKKDNNTPAFYTAQEILSLIGVKEREDCPPIESPNETAMWHTFTGLAVGPKCRYIVHHTQPYKTPWYKQVEINTIASVKLALLSTGILQPNDDGITKHALIFVWNRVQFRKFFMDASTRAKSNMNPQIIASPYTSIHMIPMTASGVMQLRCLMLSTPYEYEKSLIEKLKKLDYRFKDNDDQIYRLTLQSIPVLVAHAMDFGQLYAAWKDYEAGKKFYVSCYPEQRTTLTAIFPKVEFL